VSICGWWDREECDLSFGCDFSKARRSKPRPKYLPSTPALNVNNCPALNSSFPITVSARATNVEIHGQSLLNSPGLGATRSACTEATISPYSRYVSSGLVSERQNRSSSSIRLRSFWKVPFAAGSVSAQASKASPRPLAERGRRRRTRRSRWTGPSSRRVARRMYRERAGPGDSGFPRP
jgi:hypothetical protein